MYKSTIIASVEIGVNYISFIMANQGINWSNHYQSQYADFLPTRHQKTLQRCKGDLTFSDGNGGNLILSFFFLPAYLNLKTEAENREYYGILAQAVSGGDWSELEKRYETDLTHIREFMPYFLLNAEMGRIGTDCGEKVSALGEVFCENFNLYETNVWPREKALLDKIARQIPGLWGGEDIISQWEKQTGLEFSAPAYRILPVCAMVNGPSANSLAFDTNTFVAWDDESCMRYYRHFISHEVGTHLLVPVTINKLTNPELMYIGYIAMENLAQYLNVKMFHYTEYESGGAGYYHYDYFQNLYANLDKQNPGADMETLFNQAVEQAAIDNISPE